MEIFGVGIGEFILIIIIMLVILGPRDTVVTARKVGVFIRKIIRSPYWATMMDTSREIREIPARLVREAGLEEDLKAMRAQTNEQARLIKELRREVDNDLRSTKDGLNITADYQSIKPLSRSSAKETQTLPTDGAESPIPDSAPSPAPDEPVTFNAPLPPPKASTTTEQEVLVSQPGETTPSPDISSSEAN